MISLYNCGRRSKKWWKRLFFHLLECSMLNAYILLHPPSGSWYQKKKTSVSWRKVRFRGLRGFRCFPKRPVRKSSKFQSADLICLCETFLRKNDTINIPGYKWFGHNRANISKRAVRGSGGVGILVKDSTFSTFSIDIVDKQHEDILWISFTNINNPDYVFYVCVCYLPPAASSRGDRSHEFFDILRYQMLQYQGSGDLIICGDFNARIGDLNHDPDDTTNLPCRQILDTVINSHGKQLVDFLQDCSMITLNGRFEQDKDNFTVLSTIGKSVVDYVIVQSDHFVEHREFQVRPILDLADYFAIPTDSSMPDHSLISWKYSCDLDCTANDKSLPSKNTTTKNKSHGTFRCTPGKSILDSSRKALDTLIKELENLATYKCNGAQSTAAALENNYTKFYSVIEKEFNNHKTHHRSTRKPWWNDELDTLRKDLRQAQKE